MPLEKDAAAAFFARIKMKPLHLLPVMKMLPPGMKIPTLEIKTEIKIRLKITIASCPGFVQHTVKTSTCQG